MASNDLPTSESNATANKREISDFAVEQPGEGVVVDPVEWFDSPGPVELEIGCGKGGFLLRRSEEFPDRRFVGIEWANKFYQYATDRMRRWNRRNVRMLRTDADHFVKKSLAPNCLSALHIYHPDPWPKKRHHKRRLIQQPFIDAALNCMKSNARWAVQTDHSDYFDQIQHLLRNQKQLREVPFESEEDSTVEGEIQTNFEVKYRREGRTIYRIAFIKCG